MCLWGTMGENPHAERIQMLEDLDDDIAVALLMLEREGPAASIHTGDTDDAVMAQLNLIATHINWLAKMTEVPPEKVANDALEIATEYHDSDQYTDMAFDEYVARDE